MKKIVFCLSLFLIMLNVQAKTLIGQCDYTSDNGKSGYVEVYNNRTLQATVYNGGIIDRETSNIKDADALNRYYDQGTCYKYLWNKDNGDKYIFTDDDSFYPDDTKYVKYTLEESPAVECGYDIKFANRTDVSGDTRVRLRIMKPKNGSRVFASTLGTDGKYSNSISLNQKTNILWFSSKQDGTGVTYYIDEYNKTQIAFASTALEDIWTDMYEKSKCAVINAGFEANDGNGYIFVLPESASHDLYGEFSNYDSTNTYHVATKDSYARVDEKNTQETKDKTKECVMNGFFDETRANINSRFTYNLKFKVDDDAYRYGVEIDTDYQYGEVDEFVKVSKSSSDLQNYIRFKLDDDLQDYLENIPTDSSGAIKCPDYVGAYYVSDLDVYVLTSDKSKTSSNLKNGENMDTGGVDQYEDDEGNQGTPITTCEGYLGDHVMEFVRLARNGIMIVGPILAVVLGTYEMAVGVAKGEDEDKKKALTRFKNRLIAAVLLLITPYILEMILSFVNKSFGGCL